MKKFIAIMLAALMLVCSLVSCGSGTDYSDLEIVDLGFEVENFGIAFRSGSDMTRKVEDITLKLINDGTLGEIAEKYDVSPIENYTPSADACTDSGDWAYIQGKGELVIGITNYEPMDYQDKDDNWIGFDADYARAVCEELGVTPKFQEINWNYKLIDLESKNIDCIWNGMTITDDIENAADCTVPYMQNTQVAVVKKDNASTYTSLESLYSATVAAEKGSAGESVIQGIPELADDYRGVTKQIDALLEVLSGASDAAIVDMMLAKALIK